MGKENGRRQYSREFKTDAVKLVVDNDRAISQVSQELGVSTYSLRHWVKAYRESPSEAFPGRGRLTRRDEELSRLRKENKDLCQERDILKKAVAIFSGHRK